MSYRSTWGPPGHRKGESWAGESVDLRLGFIGHSLVEKWVFQVGRGQGEKQVVQL
jgi:hypothetical protein